MIESYLHSTSDLKLDKKQPWKSIAILNTLIEKHLQTLGADYAVKDGVAIHKTAVIGHNVTIKAPAICNSLNRTLNNHRPCCT